MAVSMKVLRDRLAPSIDKNVHGTTEETLQALRYALQTGDRGRNPGRVLAECDVLLEGFGVEVICRDGGIWGSDVVMSYVNLGDTYACTIVYDFDRQRYYVTSWGDWYEWSGLADKNREAAE